MARGCKQAVQQLVRSPSDRTVIVAQDRHDALRPGLPINSALSNRRIKLAIFAW